MINAESLYAWWKERKWRKCGKCTYGELAVAETILSGDDPRCKRLLLQLVETTEIFRNRIGDSSYVMKIPYVKEFAYDINYDCFIKSPEIQARDTLSGRIMKFMIIVSNVGMIESFIGYVEDGGRWPIEWSVDRKELSDVPTWLPPMVTLSDKQDILKRLLEWCDMPFKDISCIYERISVACPAVGEEIEKCESKLGVSLPCDYKEYLSICNGICIYINSEKYDICGTGGVCLLNVNNIRYLMLTDMYEDGIVAIDLDSTSSGSVVRIAMEGKMQVIGSLKKYLFNSIKAMGGI